MLNYVTKPSICVIAEFCLTLCDPICDHSLPASFVHGILQARVLEGVAISFTPNQDLMPNLIVVSASLKKVIFTASLEFLGQH